MQPDLPQTSCCGEADACWADEVGRVVGQFDYGAVLGWDCRN
jgi:hypothetical protein